MTNLWEEAKRYQGMSDKFAPAPPEKPGTTLAVCSTTSFVALYTWRVATHINHDQS